MPTYNGTQPMQARKQLIYM